MVNVYRRVGGNRTVWCGKMSWFDAQLYQDRHPNAFSIKCAGVK